ncbi:MAG TPA: GAF domain-containing protein [Anaerolineales bacterium]|nr:GAF domain-containing protein [Anaerolineales bacterium]
MNWKEESGHPFRWNIENLQPHSQKVRLAIIVALIILYIVTFYVNPESLGGVGAALITIPVVLAGLYFGRTVGLLAGLVSSVLNSVLLQIFVGGEWMMRLAQGVPGYIILIIAGYAAGLLKTSIDERQSTEKELRSRERYFAIINQMTQDILALKDSADLYYRLVTQITNLFVADYGYLVRRGAAQNQTVLVATTLYLDQPSTNLVLEASEAVTYSSALESGKPFVIEDVPSSGYVINPGPFKQLPLSPRSALCIPFSIQEFKFGAALIAFDTPRRFTFEELGRAEQIGKQVALGLWTIHQEAEIQKRLRESRTLSKIEQSLGETEQVGLDKVLQLIVDSARELIPGTQQAVIHLLDEENQILVPRAVSGYKDSNPEQLNLRPGEGVAGQVMVNGGVVSIADVETHADFRPKKQPVQFHSLMVAPVQSGNMRLGTISVQCREPGAFSVEQHTLLSSLGTQAAIAIENARLLETTQQSLREVNALYQITRGLVASLDAEQLMKDVVYLLQQSFGYYHVQIYVVDPETEELVMKNESVEPATGLRPRVQHLAPGAGIIGHTAETGIPFLTNNVNGVIFYIPDPLFSDVQSELAVPIRVNNRVFGVLDVQHCPPGRLSKRDLQLVGVVAEQLAVAVQRTELYSELQSSLGQEKSIRSQLVQSERLALVGRLLASVSHELNNPLQSIQNALFLLKDDRGISDQSQKDLQIVLSETERMAALIERLRSSYRPTQQDDFQVVQVNSVVEDIYVLVATHLRHNKIAFEFHPEPDLPTISGLPDQIRQVILNLFMNAVEAMPSGGRLIVSTSRWEQKEILLTVSDTGPGIDPEIMPRIFDAFITSKERGTGLGLTITYDIIQRHNGRIQVENNPDCGALFKIWFPCS